MNFLSRTRRTEGKKSEDDVAAVEIIKVEVEDGFWKQLTLRGQQPEDDDDVLPEGCGLYDVCIIPPVVQVEVEDEEAMVDDVNGVALQKRPMEKSAARTVVKFDLEFCKIFGNRYFMEQIWKYKNRYDYDDGNSSNPSTARNTNRYGSSVGGGFSRRSGSKGGGGDGGFAAMRDLLDPDKPDTESNNNRLIFDLMRDIMNRRPQGRFMMMMKKKKGSNNQEEVEAAAGEGQEDKSKGKIQLEQQMIGLREENKQTLRRVLEAEENRIDEQQLAVEHYQVAPMELAEQFIHQAFQAARNRDYPIHSLQHLEGKQQQQSNDQDDDDGTLIAMVQSKSTLQTYNSDLVRIALKNYEDHHQLKPGIANLEMVEDTSVGIQGWARRAMGLEGGDPADDVPASILDNITTREPPQQQEEYDPMRMTQEEYTNFHQVVYNWTNSEYGNIALDTASFLTGFVRRGTNQTEDDWTPVGYGMFDVFVTRYNGEHTRVHSNRQLFQKIWCRRRRYVGSNRRCQTMLIETIIDSVHKKGGRFLYCNNNDNNNNNNHNNSEGDFLLSSNNTSSSSWIEAPAKWIHAHIREGFRIATTNRLPLAKSYPTVQQDQRILNNLQSEPNLQDQQMLLHNNANTKQEEQELDEAMIMSPVTGQSYEIDFVMAALRNYEVYNGLKLGTAELAEVEATSAGVEGWAFAVLRDEDDVDSVIVMEKDYKSDEDDDGNKKPAAMPSSSRTPGRGDDEEKRALQQALLESVGVKTTAAGIPQYVDMTQGCNNHGDKEDKELQDEIKSRDSDNDDDSSYSYEYEDDDDIDDEDEDEEEEEDNRSPGQSDNGGGEDNPVEECQQGNEGGVADESKPNQQGEDKDPHSKGNSQNQQNEEAKKGGNRQQLAESESSDEWQCIDHEADFAQN